MARYSRRARQPISKSAAHIDEVTIGNKKIVTTYSTRSGKVQSIASYIKDADSRLWHRHSFNDQPAFQEFYANGKPKFQRWSCYELMHRLEGYSQLSFNSKGLIMDAERHIYGVRFPNINPAMLDIITLRGKPKSMIEAYEYKDMLLVG